MLHMFAHVYALYILCYTLHYTHSVCSHCAHTRTFEINAHKHLTPVRVCASCGPITARALGARFLPTLHACTPIRTGRVGRAGSSLMPSLCDCVCIHHSVYLRACFHRPADRRGPRPAHKYTHKRPLTPRARAHSTPNGSAHLVRSA
jgi:hypothetical protein